MPEQSYLTDPIEQDDAASRESPRHGFQGDRAVPNRGPRIPAGLTIAISREAGARGISVAQRAGEKLGWQVYPQELLEYISQEGNFRHDILENLSAAAGGWVDEQLERLQREEILTRNPNLRDLARIVFAPGATGEALLVGRGAGLMLPRASTLHVRVIAPLQDRVAYMSQRQRLTIEEAADLVKRRDQRRCEFIEQHFFRSPADSYQYDLILNSSYLGEELCAEMIVQAARAKLAVWTPPRESEADEE